MKMTFSKRVNTQDPSDNDSRGLNRESTRLFVPELRVTGISIPSRDCSRTQLRKHLKPKDKVLVLSRCRPATRWGVILLCLTITGVNATAGDDSRGKQMLQDFIAKLKNKGVYKSHSDIGELQTFGKPYGDIGCWGPSKAVKIDLKANEGYPQIYDETKHNHQDILVAYHGTKGFNKRNADGDRVAVVFNKDEFRNYETYADNIMGILKDGLHPGASDRWGAGVYSAGWLALAEDYTRVNMHKEKGKTKDYEEMPNFVFEVVLRKTLKSIKSRSAKTEPPIKSLINAEIKASQTEESFPAVMFDDVDKRKFKECPIYRSEGKDVFIKSVIVFNLDLYTRRSRPDIMIAKLKERNREGRVKMKRKKEARIELVLHTERKQPILDSVSTLVELIWRAQQTRDKNPIEKHTFDRDIALIVSRITFEINKQKDVVAGTQRVTFHHDERQTMKNEKSAVTCYDNREWPQLKNSQFGEWKPFVKQIIWTHWTVWGKDIDAFDELWSQIVATPMPYGENGIRRESLLHQIKVQLLPQSPPE